MMTSELEWDPSVFDHEFKDNGQWGDAPTILNSFDDVGDYKHRIALQHQSYLQRQDGNSIDDVINQCVSTTHSVPSVYEFDDAIFYDAYGTEFLDAPKLSQTITPKSTLNVNLIFRNYDLYLAGFLLISFSKLLNIRHSTHVFLLLLC
jgi:hypothetical protein